MLDHWASYHGYEIYHFFCNPHHLRELIYAYETHQQRWDEKLIDCLLKAKTEVDSARLTGQQELNSALWTIFSNRSMAAYCEGVEVSCLFSSHPKYKIGGGVKQHTVKNLHDRLGLSYL